MKPFSVLLISTYELGRQPLGLVSPAANLLREGFQIRCMDLAVEAFDELKIREASLIGLSVPMHTATRLGIQAARRIRGINPAAHICFYGLYASLNEEFLLKSVADSVIGGEFEAPLTGLALFLSGKSPLNPDGISTPPQRSDPFMGRQNFLPPSRHLLPPLERYVRLDDGERRRLVGAVEASRGCAHQCRHCPITPVYKGRVRIVHENVVLEDIRNLVRMGAEHISFCDPDFLNGVDHSMRVIRRMNEMFPSLTFDFTAKIQHLIEYAELLSEIKDLGCLFVQSAVETLSNRVLGILHKEHTRDDIFEALRITRGAGLTLRPSLVSFTPWTAAGDYLEVIRFVEEEDLIGEVDPVQFSIRLLIPPGSALLGMPGLGPLLGPLDEENLRFPWRHPDPAMDALEAAVLSVAEEGARLSEDPYDTFRKIKETALEVLGEPRNSVTAPSRRRVKRKSPRLTENWFCCAEPSAGQVKRLEAKTPVSHSGIGSESDVC